MLLDQGLAQPDRDLQVLAFFGQGFSRYLNDRVPVGALDLALPIAL